MILQLLLILQHQSNYTGKMRIKLIIMSTLEVLEKVLIGEPSFWCHHMVLGQES